MRELSFKYQDIPRPGKYVNIVISRPGKYVNIVISQPGKYVNIVRFINQNIVHYFHIYGFVLL